MKHTWLGLSLLSLLSATASISVAQGPETDNAQAVGIVQAHALVRQLEAQAESQRAALQQTEANLEQARALLAALEGDSPSEKKAAELRARAQVLEKRLQTVSRKVRRSTDPAVRGLKLELSSVWEEIRELESK